MQLQSEVWQVLEQTGLSMCMKIFLAVSVVGSPGVSAASARCPVQKQNMSATAGLSHSKFRSHDLASAPLFKLLPSNS